MKNAEDINRENNPPRFLLFDRSRQSHYLLYILLKNIYLYGIALRKIKSTSESKEDISK
jgi:hypothetical protein